MTQNQVMIDKIAGVSDTDIFFYLQFFFDKGFDSAASHLNTTKIEKWLYYITPIRILLQVKNYHYAILFF